MRPLLSRRSSFLPADARAYQLERAPVRRFEKQSLQ